VNQKQRQLLITQYSKSVWLLNQRGDSGQIHVGGGGRAYASRQAGPALRHVLRAPGRPAATAFTGGFLDGQRVLVHAHPRNSYAFKGSLTGENKLIYEQQSVLGVDMRQEQLRG